MLCVGICLCCNAINGDYFTLVIVLCIFLGVVIAVICFSIISMCHLCVYVDVSIVCVCVSVFVCRCVSVSVSVSGCTCVCVYMCLCLCACLCLCVCVCMYSKCLIVLYGCVGMTYIVHNLYQLTNAVLVWLV